MIQREKMQLFHKILRNISLYKKVSSQFSNFRHIYQHNLWINEHPLLNLWFHERKENIMPWKLFNYLILISFYPPFFLAVEGWQWMDRWLEDMFWGAQTRCSVSTACQVQLAYLPLEQLPLACEEECKEICYALHYQSFFKVCFCVENGLTFLL